MLESIPTQWRGYSLAGLAIFSFTIGVLFTKLAFNLSDLDFYSMAVWGWGSAMVLATLGFYIPVKSQRLSLFSDLKAHLSFFTVISVLTVINGVTWFYGMSQINGGVVALIDQNVLVWTFLLGALFLGERFSWRQLSAIGVTLIGLGIVSSLKGEVTTLGVVCLLTCGLSIATQSLLIKLYAKPFNALALTFWRGWAMFLVSWAICLSLGLFSWNIEPIAWVSIAFAQFFGLFLGRAAFIKAHEYLPMSQLSFLMLGIPVFSLLGSFVLLNEPLGPQKLIGAVVMLCGLAWFISRRARRSQVSKQ